MVRSDSNGVRGLSFLTAVGRRDWLALGLSVLAAGCGPSAAPRSDVVKSGAVLDVVATVGMVADVVREIGGERVQVTQLMGPGVDPHLYKPTRDDVRRLATADLIVSSGLRLEGRMEDQLNDVARRKPVCVLTAAIPHEHLLSPDDAEGHSDPHVWMDVSAWASCCQTVQEALTKLDPEHSAEFQTRAAAYRETLKILHEYGLSSLASVPQERRVLVTSHDAFNYFGRAYGLEVIGVQGLSTESEAGLQHINALVDLLVDRKISAVFVESSVSARNMQALIEGARSRGHEVRVGGELYSDAMGAEGTWEGTYAGMLDHNITIVTRALGGTAPERGAFGRLTAGGETP
jgi:manganese/zinc/iron transport system substrate-binding protein